MLKCREVSEQMSDYLDGESGRWRRLEVAIHILMCGHCRRFFRQLRLVSRSVRYSAEPPGRTDEQEARAIAGKALARAREGAGREIPDNRQ